MRESLRQLAECGRRLTCADEYIELLREQINEVGTAHVQEFGMNGHKICEPAKLHAITTPFWKKLIAAQQAKNDIQREYGRLLELAIQEGDKDGEEWKEL